MARYTTAYSTFSRQLREVQLLRSSAAALEKSWPIERRDDINAFCRAGIVLLSAKLEAYVKDLGEVTLSRLHARAVPRKVLAPQFYYHLSKDLLNEISGTADPASVARKVFLFIKTDVNYWEMTGAFPQPLPVDRFNKGFGNPKVDKIQAYFNRFGYSSHKRDLARLLKADYNATVNMVDHLVDVRNKIAHGDPAATKAPSDLKEMINIVQNYCAATDLTFAAWCKSSLCTIR